MYDVSFPNIPLPTFSLLSYLVQDFTLCSFSEEDYDAFCLAYMFTYRDFEGGTLGLAWTGDLKNAGGVCEKNGVSWRYFKSFQVFLLTATINIVHPGEIPSLHITVIKRYQKTSEAFLCSYARNGLFITIASIWLFYPFTTKYIMVIARNH